MSQTGLELRGWFVCNTHHVIHFYQLGLSHHKEQDHTTRCRAVCKCRAVFVVYEDDSGFGELERHLNENEGDEENHLIYEDGYAPFQISGRSDPVGKDMQIEEITPDKKIIESKIIEDDLILRRDGEGISIKIKSPLLEKFFSKNPALDGESFDGHSIYDLPHDMDRFCKAVLNNHVPVALYHEGYPNMAFLRCVGIKDGITVKIPTVCSRTELRRFARDLANNLQTIGKEYLKPVKITVQIKSEG